MIAIAPKHETLNSQLIDSSSHPTNMGEVFDGVLRRGDAVEMLWSSLLHGCEVLTLLPFGKVAPLQLSLLVWYEEIASVRIGDE
jgi:hypothetical protein